jgi:glycerol-3-phosphate dehydrogenase (NAD(P)+)
MRSDDYRVAVLGAGGGAPRSPRTSRAPVDPCPLGTTRDDPEIATRHANPTYCRMLAIPPQVRPTSIMAEALAGARHVILAVPSHGLRAVVREAAPHLPPDVVLVSATKGLETDTLHRMSEVICGETGARHPIVVLSGPSFAAEVAQQQPTALVAASANTAAMHPVQQEFRGSPALRIRRCGWRRMEPR